MVFLSKLSTNLLKNTRASEALVQQISKRTSSDGKTYRKAHFRRLYGNREQVGYGWNGDPGYEDMVLHPFPSIRYKEPTPEILALREKEKGDWKQLTLDEKKCLYRASFRLTYSEFLAPTGLWKSIVGYAILLCSGGLWLSLFMHKCVYGQIPVPASFCEESIRAQMRRKIDMHVDPIEGFSSNWDYDKKNWKRPNELYAMPNPFIDPCNGEWVENDYGKKEE